MTKDNEVTTNFEVVKHQGYWFIVSKDHRKCFNHCYEGQDYAIHISRYLLLTQSYEARMGDFIDFHPRNKYKLYCEEGIYKCRIELI